MAVIKPLTAEEEALIPVVRDEWLKIGLATAPADREAAQAAITDAYRMAGMDPPTLWIWLDSAWAGCIGAWMLKELSAATDQARGRVQNPAHDQVWEQMQTQAQAQQEPLSAAKIGAQVGKQVVHRVRTHVAVELWEIGMGDPVGTHLANQLGRPVRSSVWGEVGTHVQSQVEEQVGEEVGALSWQAAYGSHETFAYEDFLHRTKRMERVHRLIPLMRIAATAGWWWPFQGACIVTERPAVLRRDEAGALHAESGPALTYPDGWAIHAWHGLRVPSWVIEERHRITPDAIEAECNAELRRGMLEIFGFDRYIAARGAKLIAEDECLGAARQLFEIDLCGEPIRVLRVVNGTVEADGCRRHFHLGVPLTCSTPHEAVAWSYGRSAKLHTEAVRG